MFAVLQLAITLLTGWNLLRVLPVHWYKLEFWSVAYVVGLLVTTWALFLFSLVLGYAWGIPLALGVSGLGSFLVQRFLGAKGSKQSTEKKLAQTDKNSKKDSEQTGATSTQLGALSLAAPLKASLFFYTAAWGILLWALFSHHSFLAKPGGWYSGGNTWADLALHSTLIYSFEQNERPVLYFPIYPEAKLTYPFLFDFYTATLLREGMSIQLALSITSTLTALALIISMFFLIWRVTKSYFVAAVTPILFLFNSNIGTWYFLQDFWSSGMSIWEFLSNLSTNYVHFEDKELYWTQSFIDLILPQRGILVGMAALFVFCLVLYIYDQLNTFSSSSKNEKNKNLERKLHLAQDHISSRGVDLFRYFFVFLLGATPFFHIHSFLVLCGVFGWYLAVQLYQSNFAWKKFFQEWGKPFAVLLVLVVPQLFWQFGHTFGAGFTTLHFGWMKGSDGLFAFWLRNLGLELLLSILGTIYLYHSKQTPGFLKIIVFPLLALFVICNLVVFQPSIWDNTKFMVYSHWAMVLVIAVLLQQFMQKLQKRSRLLQAAGACLVILCFCILTSGGALAIIREFQLDWQSASSQDLAVAKFVRENTDPTAVFLTADTHNHLIPMLTGRPIVMGYRGWLWTYGIDYRQKEVEVKIMYQGKPNALELLKKNHVEYMYVGAQEKSELKPNQEFLKQFPVAYQSREVTIYKVN